MVKEIRLTTWDFQMSIMAENCILTDDPRISEPSNSQSYMFTPNK